MRLRQLLTFLAVSCFATISILLLRNPRRERDSFASGDKPLVNSFNGVPVRPGTTVSPTIAAKTSHPISRLISAAEQDLKDTLKRQSTSLEEAVSEYKKRYKIPPPPNFDKWYYFAREKNVQLIDEYDIIYNSLLPFWSVAPSIIRGRAREALGFNNALMGILIRGGRVVNVQGGEEWLQEATQGMMKDFVHHLPDMDLPFNTHDEPRVILPHDDLRRLVEFATTNALPASLAIVKPNNTWSSRPEDLDDGKRFPDVRTTRFNVYAHQATWTESRMSCSPDSAARNLNETTVDNTASYSITPLNFILNKTAFSDICQSPSLQSTYGFFDRPNAFNIVHDLFPIFSQSKISSFQDIIYPSPWYWSKKVPYKESQDYSWENKENKLFWRGSTTGGFSRDGGWRRQHRQRFVQKINALDDAMILENANVDNHTSWHEKEVSRSAVKHLFDVAFSHIGQCDKGDCDAQREYFHVAEEVPQNRAWAYKYLVDLDGNAFSGRFYAFLKSKSLIFKMAIFREWHEEWLRPWVHYVPLGMEGEEYVESVRYFDEEGEGKGYARKVAEDGREWAGKVLRNEDLEVWFFRLLLEYGRLVDDNRGYIGFGGD